MPVTSKRQQLDRSRQGLRYGAKVIIRDGSKLDGCEGIVFRTKDGEVQVLLDREVFWLVTEQQLVLL
jgi:hypothetical protein